MALAGLNTLQRLHVQEYMDSTNWIKWVLKKQAKKQTNKQKNEDKKLGEYKKGGESQKSLEGVNMIKTQCMKFSKH